MGVGKINQNLEAVTYVLEMQEYSSRDIARYASVFEQESRLYHALNHTEDMMSIEDADLMKVFGVGELYTRSRMWQKLAGFKHDLFQLKIDGGAPKGFEWVLGDGFRGCEYTTNKPTQIDDEVYKMVLGVFGFVDGQTLEKGANEFLTALENAHDMQQRGAKPLDIVAVTACIEASMPFRKKDKIYDLCNIIRDLNFGLSEKEIDAIGYSACSFANRDIENFAGRFLKFINKMRKNIPELSPKARADCNVVESRDCFISTINLMAGIKADRINIYSEYKDFPNQEKMAITLARSKRNASLGEAYLQARYISSTLLGAFAIKHNRADINIGEISGKLSDLLAVHAITAELDKDEKKILQALQGVDQTELKGFDNAAAPLAAFIFGILGKQGVNDAFSSAKECNFASSNSVRRFLGDIKNVLGNSNLVAISRNLNGLSARVQVQ